MRGLPVFRRINNAFLLQSVDYLDSVKVAMSHDDRTQIVGNSFGRNAYRGAGFLIDGENVRSSQRRDRCNDGDQGQSFAGHDTLSFLSMGVRPIGNGAGSNPYLTKSPCTRAVIRKSEKCFATER